MNTKYRYILVVAMLSLLVALGIVYLVQDSREKRPDSLTPSGVDIPVPARNTAIFQIAPTAPVVSIDKLFLELTNPDSLDVVIKEPSINIKGRTRIDALVTVNDYVVEPDIEGWFQQEISLKSGLNVIEIIVSVASGEQESLVLGVGYVPE